MQNRRVSIFYLIILAVMVFVFAVYPMMNGKRQTPATNTDFQNYLAEKQIDEAILNQNEEVPTGSVEYMLKDGTSGRVYVSDVK